MEWETVVGESQKVTPYWAPPDKDAAVSGRQTKLPLLSVDNLPSLDNPEQLYEEILTGLLTVNDPPIPTLPVKLDNPETLKPPEAKVKLLTVKLLPMPTLPTRLDIPVTLRVVKAATEDTVNDCAIPTLPDTFNDEPIPTNPLKYPVPVTSRVY